MTTGSTSLEVEWQFDAPDLDAVERWLRAQPAYAAVAFDDRGEKTQRDTYLDSADWRVFHAGYSLRVRTKDDASEVTLKGRTRSADGPARRQEFTERGEIESLATSDGPVGHRLRLILRETPLRPLFTVTTRRHTWAVRSASSELAEIALDDTAVDVDGASSTLQRVEVEEVEPGGLATADALVRALQTACALTPAASSKFEAGLLAAGLHPTPPDLGPLEVTPDDGAVDRAYAVLRRRFGELLVNEGGTALGEDAEALHQMRVSTRRLRAALRVFDGAVPPALLAARDELRWFAQALGAVRDLDVQLARLATLQQASAWDDANALAPLVRQFERERAEARAALMEAFNSNRYARLVESMRQQLVEGPVLDTLHEPSREAGRRIIGQRYRRFRRAARLLRKRSPHAEYHALRIRGKRLRYSLEFFVDLYGREGSLALASLRALQDLLGELQDLATTDERLRRLVGTHAEELPPETLVMVGQLIEQHRTRSTEIVDNFPRTLRPVLLRIDRLRRSPGWRHVIPPIEEPAEAEPEAIAPGPAAEVARTRRPAPPAAYQSQSLAQALARIFWRNRP